MNGGAGGYQYVLESQEHASGQNVHRVERAS